MEVFKCHRPASVKVFLGSPVSESSVGFFVKRKILGLNDSINRNICKEGT